MYSVLLAFLYRTLIYSYLFHVLNTRLLALSSYFRVLCLWRQCSNKTNIQQNPLPIPLEIEWWLTKPEWNLIPTTYPNAVNESWMLTDKEWKKVTDNVNEWRTNNVPNLLERKTLLFFVDVVVYQEKKAFCFTMKHAVLVSCTEVNNIPSESKQSNPKEIDWAERANLRLFCTMPLCLHRWGVLC